MQTRPVSPETGYSPITRAKLLVNGQSFDVASLGPTGVVVRDPQHAAPGPALIQLEVDGRITEYQVDLFDGVAPDRHEQQCIIRSVRDEGAP